MRRSHLGLTFALIVSACSSDSGGETSEADGSAGETASDDSGVEEGTDSTGSETGDEVPWPEAEAQSFCSQLFMCDCSDTSPPYADEAECYEQVHAFYLELEGIAATQPEYMVDLDCRAQLAGLAAEYECEPGWPGERLTQCAIVHGDVPYGMPCATPTPPEFFEQYSTCRSHLVCVQGFCLERDPEPLALGESCVQDPFEFECEGDLICDTEQTENCNAPPDTGEPCISQQCGPGDWCDPTMGAGEGICTARFADGEPCGNDNVCLSGVCDGTCQPAPEVPVLVCALPVPGFPPP